MVVRPNLDPGFTIVLPRILACLYPQQLPPVESRGSWKVVTCRCYLLRTECPIAGQLQNIDYYFQCVTDSVCPALNPLCLSVLFYTSPTVSVHTVPCPDISVPSLSPYPGPTVSVCPTVYVFQCVRSLYPSPTVTVQQTN